jgi:predicted nucleic acid-binding protein
MVVVPPGNRFSRDPDDDKFIHCAVAAGADAIVSGDKDLLSLGSFDGIPILLPGHFWRHETEARLDRSDG